jgi:hypothetical protein
MPIFNTKDHHNSTILILSKNVSNVILFVHPVCIRSRVHPTRHAAGIVSFLLTAASTFAAVDEMSFNSQRKKKRGKEKRLFLCPHDRILLDGWQVDNFLRKNEYSFLPFAAAPRDAACCRRGMSFADAVRCCC